MYSPIEKYTRQKNITLAMKCLVLSFVFIFISCGGGGGGDKTSPSVSITGPTGSSTYTSTATPLTISGTASDNKGISSVAWSSSAGDSGTCAGTTSWTADIPLTAGTNTITVTATDNAGNTGIATLTVAYLPPVTLSGTITVPSTNMVDSDVNDPYQLPSTPNNTIDEAQSISNPVTLGGFVNAEGSGEPDGRFYSEADTDDYFEVALSAGDSISLYISDYDSTNMNPDLDLELYDSSEELIAGSYGPVGSEFINTSEIDGFSSDTYYIRIHINSGSSNYILSIGSQTGVSTGRALSSTKEFVPGQAIVRFKDGTTAITSVKKLSDRVSSMGLGLKAGKPGQEALVSFDTSKKASTFKTLGIEDNLDIKAVDDKTQKKLDTLHIIKALRKRSDVETADPNYILHTTKVPDDEYYNSYQWNLPLINLPQAWDTTTGNNSVIVAVVDTGVLMDHPDLSGNLTDDGYDFISDTSISNDGDGVDDDPDDPGDSTTAGLSSFHGTHVAGIIAAETNNSDGIAGVSWSTKIMPVRAMGIDGGTEYDILQGVRYAAGLSNDSETVPTTKADIINLSLGNTSYSGTAQEVYDDVRTAGVIVIAAAGNDSNAEAFYPASYDGVVSVSATDINNNLASYSNYGSYVDVAAPGGDSGDLNGDGYSDYVLSTCGDDSSGAITFEYVWMAGTSMAAPHVAGVAALMKAVNSTLTPENFDQFLVNGDLTYDIGDTERDDKYGYGLIDAYKAVLAAASGEAPTVLTVSPASLNFGQSLNTLTLTASQLGSDTLGVTGYSVSDGSGWLTITEKSVDSTTGLGAYTVEVDRTGLSSGTYTAAITFTSNLNTVTVPVNIQVNTTGTTPDAGHLYVLLYNSDAPEEDPAMIETDARDGFYTYSFADVPQGTYEIYAGSDRDNDYYIGDAGEAFGAYQTTDQPTEIIADSDQSGLNFNIDYYITLTSAAKADVDNSNYLLKRIKQVTNQTKRLAQ